MNRHRPAQAETLLSGAAGDPLPAGVDIQPAALGVAFEYTHRRTFGQHPVARLAFSQGREQAFTLPPETDRFGHVDEIGGGAADPSAPIVQRNDIEDEIGPFPAILGGEAEDFSPGGFSTFQGGGKRMVFRDDLGTLTVLPAEAGKGAADQLFPGFSEQPPGAGIGEADAPLPIHRENAAGDGIQQDQQAIRILPQGLEALGFLCFLRSVHEKSPSARGKLLGLNSSGEMAECQMKNG